MLNQMVKELLTNSRCQQELVLALAGLGITPCFALRALREAAEAVGPNPDTVEREVHAATQAAHAI